MDAQRNRQAVDRWFRALNTKQFDKLAALLADIANDDVIQEWPQSGERIRGKDNIMAVLQNYPGLPQATVSGLRGSEDNWVLTPSWTPLRIIGTGDHYTLEGWVAYPTGEVWNVIDLFDFRDGKLIKVTEYFAAPFPAAEWRAKWVERFDPPTHLRSEA